MTVRFALMASVLMLPFMAAAQERIGDSGLGIGDWSCPTLLLERAALLSAADPAGSSCTTPGTAIPGLQFRILDAQPPILNPQFPVPNAQSPILNAQAPTPDRWFGPDKVRHFFTSALLQSLGYGTLRAMDVEHGSALAGASAITAGFGIGKELSDRRRGYGFSARDLVWDVAGAAAASFLLARTER